MPNLPQAETAPQNEADFSQLGVDDGAHIDALIGTTPEAVAVPHGQLDKGSFHKLFCGSFVMTSHLSGLKSLHVEEGEGTARAASEAIYDTILEIPALHFILQPGSGKMLRILAIGAFFVPMSRAVGIELNERRAGARVPLAQGKTSNPFPIVNMGG